MQQHDASTYYNVTSVVLVLFVDTDLPYRFIFEYLPYSLMMETSFVLSVRYSCIGSIAQHESDHFVEPIILT
jgi:hypothetical protein